MAMSDVASQLSQRQMSELCALADGSLPADRRAAVEAWIASSPELQALLERQRRSLAATQTAASEPLPPLLPASVEAQLRERRRPGARQLLPRLAFGGVAAAAVVVVLVVAVGGGTSGPTVADAAELAALPPTGPAPARAEGSRAQLTAGVEGVNFPNLRPLYGWQAAGVRMDSVDGRDATVVYYRKDGRRIAYVIVSGSALPQPSGANPNVRRGVEYDALSAAGHPTVTWQRVGHTCVLTGAASRAELLALASWHGGGTLRY
jgi:anti-sigma factor RsiW